ncbi:MAG: hypothetical protein ACOH5I_11905 [Oligoflexus sp.]
MVWKVYNIQNGKTLRAGFETEDEAKEWLELKGDDLQDHYEVEEMDYDEEEEWLESQEAEDIEEEEDNIEDEETVSPVGFGEDYYDGTDLADDEDDLSVIEDEEIS